MAQVLQVRHKGLYTAPNEFSSVPEGALLLANNLVLTVDNIIEPRRGRDRIATLSDASYRHSKFEFYQDQHMSNWTGGNIGYKNSTTFTAVSGTYNHPSATLARTRFLLSQSNLYFTSDVGVYRMDAYNATPALAGMYKGLDISLALSGSSGFLATANEVAYRIVWGFRDANSTLILGAPSGRAIITNATGGTRDITVTTTIPSGITASYFFQVYRSKASGGASIVPDDELGLVYENNPSTGGTTTADVTNTSATLTAVASIAQARRGVSISGTGIPANTTIVSWTATTIVMSAAATATNAGVTITIGSELTLGTVTFTDRTSDDLRGATLYTSVSQEGIGQANDRPPQADDFEEFQGSIIYANTKSKHRKTFTLLATTTTGGIAYADTVTIAGTAYTYGGTESVATRTVALYGGTTTTGDTTNASPTITNVASIAALRVGKSITGTGIPANTFIGTLGATTIGLVDAAGVAVNATATNAGVTLTFADGTPSQNIADTAASLVRIINRNTTNTTVYAYYLSGPDDLPGEILIEERAVGGASFALIASANGTAYNPVLPTSGTTVSSTNDDFQNALMFSKNGKGEAVPLLNILRVGSANTAIRRIKKLRNSLFIFKEREGIYRLTGTDPSNFQVDLFDSSAKLLAPESVEVVNNQIWCLCDQGITVVTETGVSVVSRPIEDLILDQFGAALNAVRYYSFGVGYETERQYILYTVSTSSDTVATQAFVFNVFTQSYTRWPESKSAGKTSPVDDKLYLGNGASYDLEQERKTRTFADYIDYGTACTIDSFSGTTVYLASTSGIVVGDLLYQSASVQSLILQVETGYVVVQDTITWAIAAATFYAGINCELEYAAVTGSNPGVVHQFPEISMLFKAARFYTATLAFATDMSAYFEDVPILGNRTGLWGLFPWGQAAWGGTATTLPIRTFIPLEKQRGSLLRVRFTHRQGYGYFKSLGFSAVAREISYVVAK